MMEFTKTALFVISLICILVFLTYIVAGRVPADQRIFFGMLTAFSVGGILLTTIILWILEKVSPSPKP